MKRQMKLFFLLAMAVVFFFSAGLAGAAEILVEDVIERNLRLEDVFEKVADNFIVLFDASGSTAETYKDSGMTKIDLSKKILHERHAAIPKLGYNAGLYLYTPWKSYYEMQPHDMGKYMVAIGSLPTAETAGTYRGQSTPLGIGIRNLDPILAGLTGRTVVFLFSDGSFSMEMKIYPQVAAKELAAKYDVCFYVISSAETAKQMKVVEDIAAVNECSRVVPFDAFLENPDYYMGALFVVKTNEVVESIIKEKVVGFRMDDVRFDFNQFVVRPEYGEKLQKLAQFLKDTPKATLLIQGFTDSVGSQEYNLNLSRRRAESVGRYLTETHQVDPGRMVLQWYGKANPIADNTTEAGRQLNRRVELDISGL